MAYAQYGNIAAADYNALVGGNPVTASGYLNTVWATGGTTAGYGQTALANVTVGTQVYAADWANLVNKTAINGKVILQDISKVSDTIAANFGFDAIKIAEAVTNASNWGQ